MNLVHLIYIIPCCFFAGYLFNGFIVGASLSGREERAYRHGIEVGKRMKTERLQLPYCQTLEELFDRGFDSDFNKFTEVTGGIIYGTEDSGQMFMIFINDTDTLCQYYDKELLWVNDEAIYQRPVIKTSMV